MPRRIDVELTSRRDDGSWTWRKAKARQPKGELDGGLLYEGAKVGDVVSAEADFDIEGITVTAVTPPKGARREADRIELIVKDIPEDQLVIETRTGKGGRRDEGGPREGRDGRDKRRGPRSPRSERGGRADGDRRPRSDSDRRPRRDGPPGEGGARRDRPARPARPAPEPRPKAKRLRPGRVHRTAVLDSLPEEQKPIAEAVLRGGIPAVRQAVDKQNEEARAAGTPEIKADGMISIAEQLLPRLRTAEWHDRADAALAEVDELDLRDLRSVVVAADVAARDDETRELAQNLRDALARRVDQEHTAWLAEVAETLADGRTVRALRLSSRPPKAGSPLPADLAAKLTEATNAALTTETGPDRFATVLDALAYSPVRQAVVPLGVPAEPGEALLAAVRKIASRVPQIAKLFGIEPAPARPPRSRGPRSRTKPVPAPPAPASAIPEAEAPASPEAETPASPEAETPVVAEAPAVAEVPAELTSPAPTEAAAPVVVEPEPVRPVVESEATPAAADDVAAVGAPSETPATETTPSS